MIPNTLGIDIKIIEKRNSLPFIVDIVEYVLSQVWKDWSIKVRTYFGKRVRGHFVRRKW